MLSMNDLKVGTVFTWKNEPHVVLTAQHVQMGRGSAIVRTKMKNILNGNVFEETFKNGDKLEEAELGRGKASFLYADGGTYYFMDSQTYDQFGMSVDDLGMKKNFLKEGQEVDIVTYKEKPVRVDLPMKMAFQVSETTDAIRGNTTQGNVMKDAMIETGFAMKVPLFVKQGDMIRVNTETGEYVERA